MRLAASQPPEERGLGRDGVRLLVATPDGMVHARFGDLPRFLSAGDLLVINTSATIAAAVDGRRGDGRPVVVHFSSPLDEGTPWAGSLDGRSPGEGTRDQGTPSGGPAREGAPGETQWLVELREDAAATGPVTDAAPGESITLPAGGSLTLLRRYPGPAAIRMWAASVAAGGDVGAFLARRGQPIRYSYVPDPWPLPAYQTVFARTPGSAEMPSAGRPFTAGLVTDLAAAGVVIAPITLHAGVASLEAGEPPLPERFAVPEPTAQLVNLTRAEGRRVVAVGTTCTRALESAADAGGTVHARHGWTDLVLGAGHPARIVSGLVTGWHDPEASHLALLEAVAGQQLVHAAYLEAERAGYLWHEFGDSCLLLPPLPPGPR
ncbi:MAG TPA: S-adenosylmethionine:tRNA ribosyltransferase-isomerase [Streptosporangiaceae bacterium]|nr:S-adenosylmethionine:tRNA ribosyltransferase-isomerase [Streptosporangiaceae bacterium]